MNFIKEIIWSVKCGSLSGKGHKYSKKGEINKALLCYQKALAYSDNVGEKIIIIECIARSYARIGELNRALYEAKKCISLLHKNDSSSSSLSNTEKRITSLIEALENNDTDKINDILVV